jgi:hypothetical protein
LRHTDLSTQRKLPYRIDQSLLGRIPWRANDTRPSCPFRHRFRDEQ